jgi:superfamily II DNA or RNA helicase
MTAIGNKVRIKGKDDEGIIISIKDSFAEVNIENQNQWVPISDLEEISDELVSRILKNDLDDGIDFILGIDAHRLLTEYRFNPYVLASSTKIQIFPHQIDEVIWGLENPKILIADEVGLGKTIIAALIATELRARGLANKSLFVVPKSLVLKWKGELENRFDFDVKILDSSYMKFDSEPFDRKEFAYVASMDFLKQEHIKEKIQNDFDVVIVDEAHKFKIRTDRLELGKVLAARSNVLIFLTATPHDGRDDDFMSRISLLDPYVGDIASSSYLWTRNIKEDVRDIQGKTVFPPRTSKTVDIPLTNAEREINNLLKDYFDARYAEAKNQKEINAVRFLSHIFRKRASSSITALKISLKRRLDKLGTINVDEILKMQSTIHEYDEEIDPEYENEESKIDGFTLGTDIENEKTSLRNILSELEKLGTRDTKYDILKNSIKELKVTDPKTKILLFTEYRDTLEYLIQRLSEHYKIGKIDGTMKIQDRSDMLLEFRKDDGPEILLCTDAAGEGIDMQFCNIEYNYDLPWNPNKLEQRMGRIHRIGQTREVFYYNFVVDKESSIDGYILSKLLDKIENIKASMGEKIYDVIGIILNSDDIAKYYEELLKVPKAHWEAKVSELLEKIEENKNRILEKSNLLLEGHRLDRTTLENIAKIRKNAVDIGEVKRFLHMLIESKEGKFEEINKSESRYKIFPPQKFAQELNLGVIEGTFNPQLANEKGWPYLALGNKEINSIILKSAGKSVASLTHPTKSGLLCVYKISVIDGNGRERDTKIIAMFHNEDAKVTEIDPRSIWDYDQGDEIKNTAFITNSKNRIEEELTPIVETHRETTTKKIQNIETKTKLSTKKYFIDKIEQANSKIDEYNLQRSEGPQIEKLISRQKNQIQNLKKGLDERLDQIKKEFVTKSTIELIGIASIKSEQDANVRRETELAGMDAVMKYEKHRAPTEEKREKVIDISDRDTGYDVESWDRCIEVKSFKKSGPAKLTSHEWKTAERLQDDYWLYVVENAQSEPKITIIQNPYEKFKDSVKTEESIEYRYVIDNWNR